ncbi:P-loop containing nucleoside triphosphate hydrolase protein [Jimgerdemannia flammicorona]|uniref:P-loop containing nucleoside triphosphate hydrolase protein n=1 Tax=Jimgerdemannia flammicorona TaxID=994334 RepID=A0A433DCP1_9FUNG|nr:P-loop containing nucleoside triphosphate hydrolase protein [Jimgerdemannia flammicorona]
MEATYEDLAGHLVSKLKSLPSDSRYLVAVSGIPGSGKTTLANEVGTRVNVRWKREGTDAAAAGQDVAIVMPMDGFHLTRAQLDAFENREEAHHRRGAHWTFDPDGTCSSLGCPLLNSQPTRSSAVNLLLRRPLTSETVTITGPSFDHAVKDPVEHDIKIEPHHKLIIVEGIYLHLSHPDPWPGLADLFDGRWFITVDLAVARERVARRHVRTGLSGYSYPGFVFVSSPLYA